MTCDEFKRRFAFALRGYGVTREAKRLSCETEAAFRQHLFAGAPLPASGASV